MAQIVKLSIGGRDFDAVEKPFDIGKEDWNEYELLDGGTVRVKTTVQKIFQIVDDQGNAQRTGDGDLQIMVKHNTQIVVSE